MNTNATPGNTPTPATRFGQSENVSRHLVIHQSAAMRAALLVRSQYSRAAKFQFSRLCLDHLKASLAHVQDVSV